VAGLIERLMGINADGTDPGGAPPDRPKLPVHAFQATAAEWARSQMSGAQAQTAIAAVSQGTNLNVAEQAEAQALVNSVPVGSTTAIQAARALRLIEIEQVLLMVDQRVPPYDSPAAVRTRLGL
jgi:hypothetical protein